MVRELLRSAEVRIGLRSQALIVQKTLLLSVVEGLPLDLLFQTDKRAELLRYGLRDTLELNLLLATGAGHESKGDPQRGPLVPKQLHHAIGVENVPARQSGARLSSKLLSVADGAELILVDSIKVTDSFSAVFIEARKALALVLNALAGVAALLVLFVTEFKCRQFFQNSSSSFDFLIASINHFHFDLLLYEFDYFGLIAVHSERELGHVNRGVL